MLALAARSAGSGRAGVDTSGPVARTMRGAGRQLAARLEKECGGDAACRVKRAYALALARQPEAQEVEEARAFVAGGGAWEDFALAMLNRNEFVYVP